MNPFVSLDAMTGYVAMWATRQSPYHAPDGLTEVLREFYHLALNRRMTEDWCIESWPCILATRENLRSVVEECLLDIPQVRQWNERKNGNQSPFQFVSRYDGHRNPDDDFIDLDALRMNVVRSCMDEAKPENRETELVKSSEPPNEPTNP